jgi:hypothetical protein
MIITLTLDYRCIHILAILNICFYITYFHHIEMVNVHTLPTISPLFPLSFGSTYIPGLFMLHIESVLPILEPKVEFKLQI